MADHITDEQLRQMADGWYCGSAQHSAVARELLAARAEIRAAVLLLSTAWCDGCGDGEWARAAARFIGHNHKETDQ